MIRSSCMIPLLTMVLIGGTARSQEGDKSPAVFGLRTQETEIDKGIEGIGLLYREVFRQAVLLSARESLGLLTRDQALRESLPEEPGTLGCALRVTAPGNLKFTLTSDAEGATKTVWETTMPIPGGRPCSVRPLAPLVEPLSRGALVEALKAAGFSGKATAAAPDEAVPAGVEERLRELTFTEPYAALRELHAACRRSGESPQRLGAIVRAYANLGQLSRGLWNASSKVFAARSLLYAERLRATAPGTRTALWHRAYAYVLLGLPKAGLEDLEAAAALHDSKEEPPPWVDWLDACCKEETPRLMGPRSGPDSPLKRFLAFLTVERCGSSLYELQSAGAVLEASPDCYRAIDAMCSVGGVSNLHTVTLLGPRTLGARIYGRLKGLPSLPGRVSASARGLGAGAPEPQVRTLVWKALLASPEPSEPSWPLLGRLIEETTFMQIVRRGDFMHDTWGVPTGEFVDEVAPLIAEHPCRSLVRSYALDAPRQQKEWAAMMGMLRLSDITEDYQPLASAAWYQEGTASLGRQVWAKMWRHLDATAPDLEWALLHTGKDADQNRRSFTRYLMALHPNSAIGIATSVELDWDSIAPRAGELEKTLGHNPRVLHALGARYIALGRPTDAERCLKAEIGISPSVSASRALAGIYLNQGDEDKWLATLEKALEGSDPGLDHASVRVEIAEHFMKVGKFDKAEPYAAAAAETWAAWAMECAVKCYEGLHHWDKAELWVRRVSERYDGSQLEWFFWCKRHGKGDLRAAEDLARTHLAQIAPRATPEDQEILGIVSALTGDPRQAMASFQKAFEATENPYDGLHVALLAFGLKDTKVRDAALIRVIEKGPVFQNARQIRGLEVPLAKEFRNLLDLGAGAPPNPGAFERILDQAPDSAYRANAAYFVGRFLELQVSPEAAKPFYEDCIKTGQTQKWNYVLSKESLRRSF